ncbi:MAG TPA: [protein-PII] uridylyltransferase [Acetobacteraceae bacterium]|jgi:[protein-PII] uridylyltransferase|nr:[protein-PII] uridylyltransferase [Acetobacteraceae bacterium]
MLSPIPLPEAPEAATCLLTDSLRELAEATGIVPRDQALGAFRRHLARIQSHVQTGFEANALSGLQAARLLGALIDGMLRTLHDYTVETIIPGHAEPFAMVGTGGYGRGVLAPFSDIDLLFLTAAEPGPRVLQAVEFMLYLLWDLGLKVGHATRSIAECAAEAASDTTVRTSLIDARQIAGSAPLYAEFEARYGAACEAAGFAGFIAAKQAERDARHRRFGDSPFLVEPNVKEGRGGLRDLQTLYWLSRYVFGTQVMSQLVGPDSPGGGLLTEHEAQLARRCWSFLWTVRFHLHYIAGRAEERLTFDLQPVVGARMGYTRHGRQDGVERFMRHYFLTAREITRLTRVLEPAIVRVALGPPALAAETDPALLRAGFVLADGKLMPSPVRDFRDEPVQMLRLLQIARDRDLALHPLSLRALIRNVRGAMSLRGDPEAAALFLDLLCGRDAEHIRSDGARWLSILNETGFLGRFIPDWARIVGQMQFDTYHVFTVDEHTIEAVRVLNALERGELADVAPVSSGLVEDLQSRRALYVAMLLHDIAKGRGGDHSEIGAEIALDVGPTLGLSAEETETVSWLVLHHLLLSQTAFHRDIDDPKTILDLSDTIQSPERLKLLLILTVADMRAVSPRVWNGWKATLLRELYARVAEVLAGGLATTERDTRTARAKEAVTALLPDWDDTARAEFFALGYPSYWLAFDPETQARHARLVRGAEARHAPLTVNTEVLPARAVTEVTVYTADHAGLFSRIAGALAVAGASIVDARIHTLTNGMALDTFWIQDAAGGVFDAPHRLARLYVLVEQALTGRLRLAAEIRRVSKALLGNRMRAIHVPPRVVVDNRASNTHTVVEVNGRDRPGLLHDVTAAISEQGLQIASAHVTTYGVRAVDVFYIKDIFGLKVENERKLGKLREALVAALVPPEEAQPRPLPAPRRRSASAA